MSEYERLPEHYNIAHTILSTYHVTDCATCDAYRGRMRAHLAPDASDEDVEAFVYDLASGEAP